MSPFTDLWTSFKRTFCAFACNPKLVNLEQAFMVVKNHTWKKHHGCDTALLSLTEEWKKELDNHKVISLVSMDLSKAFDTVHSEKRTNLQDIKRKREAHQPKRYKKKDCSAPT
ncbi:hypothetical protein ACROYT_G010860 [Oculina patagonica]